MFKNIKINKTTLREFIKWLAKVKKLPWILGKHAFLIFLVLLFLFLIMGGFVFYKYNILIKNTEPKISEKTLQFEERAYQNVLAELQNREKRFNEAPQKEYKDPFQEKSEESNINPTAPLEKSPITYTVLEKETLWAIAERFLGSAERWREIKSDTGKTFSEAEAYNLPIGQKLVIPAK